MKHYNLKFDSLTALSRFIHETPPKGYFKNETLASTYTSDRRTQFTKTANFEEAEKLMAGGYLEGAKRVQTYMLKTAGNGIKNTLYNDIIGFAPNVPNYLAGIPTNMLNRKKTKAKKNIIRIFINSTVDYTIEAEQIEQAAARLFNVIVGIEKSGCRVELYSGWLAEVKAEQINAAVCIKPATTPLNINSVAYAVVHPSFFRRHGLAVIERSGVRCKWSNYGYVITNESDQRNALKQLHLENSVLLNYYTLNKKTEAEIATEIERQIKQLRK